MPPLSSFFPPHLICLVSLIFPPPRHFLAALLIFWPHHSPLILNEGKFKELQLNRLEAKFISSSCDTLITYLRPEGNIGKCWLLQVLSSNTNRQHQIISHTRQQCNGFCHREKVASLQSHLRLLHTHWFNCRSWGFSGDLVFSKHHESQIEFLRQEEQ